MEIHRTVLSDKTPLSANLLFEFLENAIIVADKTQNKITVFDYDGVLKTEFGREGGGPGEFRGINSISSDGQNIFVHDSKQKRISEYSLSGEYIRDIPYKITAHQLVDFENGFLSYNGFSYQKGEGYITAFSKNADEFLFQVFEPSKRVIDANFPFPATGHKNVVYHNGVVYFVHPFDFSLYTYHVRSQKMHVIPLVSPHWKTMPNEAWKPSPNNLQFAETIVLDVSAQDDLLLVSFIQSADSSRDENPLQIIEFYQRDGKPADFKPIIHQMDKAIYRLSHHGFIYGTSYEDGTITITKNKVKT